MRYIGIPTCPYCRKRVNLIRTWSLKRQGEYQCPRCGGISNIFLSPLVYVLALLAVFGGGAMYFFYKFVLDDITLKTALYVFVPFAAFFLLSLFMVYLEKPVIKKVSKDEYNKRRNKREGAQAYDRTGDYQPEPNTGYLPRNGGQARAGGAPRRPEAAAPMSINQENFHKAKQQTASINAVHERRGTAAPRAAQPAAPAQRAPASQAAQAELPESAPQRENRRAAPQRAEAPRPDFRKMGQEYARNASETARPQVQDQPQVREYMPPAAQRRSPAPPLEAAPYQRPAASRAVPASGTGELPGAYQRPTARPVQGTAYQPGGAYAPPRPLAQRPAEGQRPAQPRAQVPGAYAAYQPRNAVGQRYEPPRRSTRVTGSVEHPSVGGSIFEKYNDPNYGRHSAENPEEDSTR